MTMTRPLRCVFLRKDANILETSQKCGKILSSGDNNSGAYKTPILLYRIVLINHKIISEIIKKCKYFRLGITEAG